MTTSLILPLDAKGVTLATAGGKGVNLARLVRAGFPVPLGYIVTTLGYDTFIAANELRAWILDLMRDLQADDPRALETTSALIRARFAAGHMPSQLADAIVRAYATMGRPGVAVRSSATAEDLPGLSFAGQQDTHLNVVGDNALHQAVVNCWSSLWAARAIGYRTRNGISHRAISLAVVVQEMVPSEVSGVLFTANPLSGKRGEVVIDAIFGLGEALVSGQVEPDQYVVDGQAKILHKMLGDKSLATQEAVGGGTVTHVQDGPRQQALPDPVIVELASLGRRVAQALGEPQDIEWAAAGGRLYLLQSRPITTLYPTPEDMPPQPLQVWLSFGSVQGMLDPVTPLGRDLMRAAFAGAAAGFGYTYTAETQPTLQEAGQRLWVNTTGLLGNRIGRRLALGALETVEPGVVKSLRELVEGDDLPPPGGIHPRTTIHLALALLPLAMRALRALLWPDVERERLLGQLEAMIADFRVKSATTASLTERVALARQMTGQAFHAVVTQFVPRFGMGMAALNLLRHLATRSLVQANEILQMTRGLPHNVTTEMDLALWQVARTIQADPNVAGYCKKAKASTLADQYLQRGLPERAQSAIARFLQRYGARGLGEVDVGRPRWREDPTPLMQALQSYLQIDSPDQAPDAVFERGRVAAQARIASLCDQVRRTKGGWFRARLVRWAAYRMRALAGLRESPKFAAVRMLDVIREMLQDGGRELTQAGQLAQPDDVFFLRLAELEALARGEQGEWIALVRERRQKYDRERLRKQVPRLLLSDGRAYYKGVATPVGQGGASVIYGSPVSPGIAEGIAHVVLDPRGAQLTPGEIMVCPGTDPSWTPLFLAAGGLVMEVGGLMTHGSVVAREYGIPAVVGVDQVTRRLQTGQRIRVDGTAGRIEVVENVDKGRSRIEGGA